MRRYLRNLYFISMVLVIFAITLTGCSKAVPEHADRIESPSIQEVPFAGTWVLEKNISGNLAELADSYDPMQGGVVGFSQNSLLFDGKIYYDIRYKVKRVNVYEYFLHKKDGLPETLDCDNCEIVVTTVYSSDNFLFEFIEDENGTKVAVIDDSYYSMKKTSDDFSTDQKVAINESEQNALDDSRDNEQPVRSGLLLGVRIPVKTADGLGGYKYGTYWISTTDNSAHQVLYADDIYLPRMDGFWKLIVEERLEQQRLEDTLIARKVSNIKGKLTEGVLESLADDIETRISKAIVYVGNDYVCVENSFYSNNGDEFAQSGSGVEAGGSAASGGAVVGAPGAPGGAAASGAAGVAGAAGELPRIVEKTLRTLPVDNLSSVDGIKISDMAGENGIMAMENAIADVLKNSGYEGILIYDNDSQEKNFALYRKTGHWFFKGRIDPDGRGQLPFMDFNLNLLPPSNMVAYDALHVPWTEMKDKLPLAIDIYTSPNEDIAIVLTRSEILLYAIENRRLSEQPIARLRMEEGSTVIMAEWGMGDYVTSWEKSFIKNNETRVVENLLDAESASVASQP